MLCSAGLHWRVTTTEERGPMPMMPRKVCQVGGCLLLLSALCLMLSVGSYSPDDPNSNHYVSDRSTMLWPHVLGVRAVLAVKSWLADWALQIFGSGVALLTAIAVIGAWYLTRGHLRSTMAVVWRGLLCLVTVSACANLAFTSVHIRGTQFHAGGFGGKWLADSVVDGLSLGIARFVGGFGSQWLVDNAVAHFSRPGAYGILGMIALGALCVGVRHPILTALRGSLRSIGRGSWALVRGVRQGLVKIGGMIRQGGAIARWLGGVVTRRMWPNTLQPSDVQQPEMDEHTAPCSPAWPATTLAVSAEAEPATVSSAPSARQADALSAVPTAAARRKRPPAVTPPPSVGRPHGRVLRICCRRLTSWMAQPRRNGGQVRRNWRRRRIFLSKSCANLGLRVRSCRCYQARSSRCMSL